MRRLFKNLILTDSEGTKEGSLLTENDRIKEIVEEREPIFPADEVIDCKGLTMLPGFVDFHCHLRDPGLTYKEDIDSGLKAAAKGGFTTVCAMANTLPVTDSKDKVLKNLKKAKDLKGTKLIQVAALTEDFSDDNLANLEALSEVTPIISNDGHNVDNEKIMEKALKESDKLKLIIATHNEPETETVKRDVKLLEENGGRLHVQHISKKETLEAIKEAKEKGLDITCEVTPHHLFKSELEYKVHPPFRKEEDRLSLIDGIKNKDIDCFGTDHAPHSKEDKEKGAPGIDNFETAFGIYRKVLDENGISLNELSEHMSKNPSKLLGLEGGEIKEGLKADLTLVDPDEEWQVDTDDFISKSKNTPFNGEKLKGKVHMTVSDGNIIYNSGKVDVD